MIPLRRLGFACVVTLLLVQSGYTQGTPADGESSSDKTILITTLGGFATMLATQFFAFWREARNRRWDLENREAARAEMRRHAEVQRLETYQTAIELAKVSEANRQKVVDEVRHNTEITKQAAAKAEAAYTAANNFNAKYEDLRRELMSRAGQIDTIENVTDDTNKKVTDMKDGDCRESADRRG